MTGPSRTDNGDPTSDPDRRASDELDAWLALPAGSAAEPLRGRAAEMLRAREALRADVVSGGSESEDLVAATMSRLEEATGAAPRDAGSRDVGPGDAGPGDSELPMRSWSTRSRSARAATAAAAAAAVIILAGLVLADLAGPRDVESADDSAADTSTAATEAVDPAGPLEPAERQSTPEREEGPVSAGGDSTEPDAGDGAFSESPGSPGDDGSASDDPMTAGRSETGSPFAGVHTRGTIRLGR